MEGEVLELDKDDLTPLLDSLVEQSPLGSRELGQMRRLQRIDKDLKLRLEKSRQRYVRWEKSKSTIHHLIAEHDFLGQLQELGRPYRLLGGEINLESDQQRHALSELVVTLESEGRERPMLQQIARALNLYYREYFHEGQGPQREDEQLVAKEKAFSENPEEGASEAYQIYLDFSTKTRNKDLKALEESKQSWPVYAPILLADAILSASDSLEMRRSIFSMVEWGDSHLHLLYRVFDAESDEGFARSVIEVLRRVDLDHHLSFFDRQLSKDHHGDLIRDELTKTDTAGLESLRSKALEKNCAQVLAVLTNALGMDPSLYYQALQQEGLESDVFSRLVEWLFKPVSQRHYGMDAVYAQRVLELQKDWPRKMISVLQNAMPRGIEGQSLKDALLFFEGLQERRLSLAREKSSVNPQREGRRHCELSLSLSDLESARFILFSYIHDRVVAARALPKVTGMSLSTLADHLMRIEDLEIEVGPNPNIMEHLVSLYRQFPPLKKTLSNEVS